MIINVDW